MVAPATPPGEHWQFHWNETVTAYLAPPATADGRPVSLSWSSEIVKEGKFARGFPAVRLRPSKVRRTVDPSATTLVRSAPTAPSESSPPHVMPWAVPIEPLE